MQVQWQSNSNLHQQKYVSSISDRKSQSISVDCSMLIKCNLIFNNQTMNETVRVPPSSLFWLNLIKLGQKMGEKELQIDKIIPMNFSHFSHLISCEKFLASQFLVFFSRDNACQAYSAYILNQYQPQTLKIAFLFKSYLNFFKSFQISIGTYDSQYFLL